MPAGESQLDRIERKVDQMIELQRQLVDALADEGEPQPSTLEAEGAGKERDQTQSLDNSSDNGG